MFSVVFLRSYRRPRELTWLSGHRAARPDAGLRFQRLPAALEHRSPTSPPRWAPTWPAASPVIGHALARFLRGGEDVGGATLTRFFGFHVVVLPGLTTALIGLHLLLVQSHGMSPPERKALRINASRPHEVLPQLLPARADGRGTASSACWARWRRMFPWELGEKADPFASAPAGIRPEWYFLAQFYTLKLIPSHVWFMEGELLGLAGFGLLAVGWVRCRSGRTEREGSSAPGWPRASGVFLVCLPRHLHAPGIFQMTTRRAMSSFSSPLVPARRPAADSCVDMPRRPR